MILKQRGIISVCNKKLITSLSSIFTKAPITPRDVSLRYSNGLPLLTVLRNGYRNKGIWALRNSYLVSLWDATHYKSANTLHALFEVFVSKLGGESYGYTDTISYKRAAMVPTECQMKGASSEKCSLCLLSSTSALSLLSLYFSSSMNLIINCLSSSETWELLIKLPGAPNLYQNALKQPFKLLQSRISTVLVIFCSSQYLLRIWLEYILTHFLFITIIINFKFLKS